jgi:hypothetical protein
MQDEGKAVHYYRLAADKGHAQVMERPSMLTLYCVCVVFGFLSPPRSLDYG